MVDVGDDADSAGVEGALRSVQGRGNNQLLAPLDCCLAADLGPVVAPLHGPVRMMGNRGCLVMVASIFLAAYWRLTVDVGADRGKAGSHYCKIARMTDAWMLRWTNGTSGGRQARSEHRQPTA